MIQSMFTTADVWYQCILSKFNAWAQGILDEAHPWAQGILTKSHVWAQGILNKILLRVLSLAGRGPGLLCSKLSQGW